MIHLKRGDVLGLYFPKQNPIGWSSVPCAGSGQTYRYLNGPTGVMVGKTFTFSQALLGDESACRHYAFTSIFGKYTLNFDFHPSALASIMIYNTVMEFD